MGVTLQATSYIDPTRGNKMNVNNENINVNLITEDSTGVGDQAPVSVNVPGSSNKKFIQQAFHPSLFLSRPRSASVGSNLENRTETRNTASETTPTIVLSDKASALSSWQKDHVPAERKRKRKENSPNQNEKSNKITKNSTQYTVPIHNQFDILEDDKVDKINKEQTYTPKPEPIFVTGVINIAPLKQLLNNTVDCKSYTITTLRSGHIVKILPQTIDGYKKIRDSFTANNISHYTYQLKCERAYRVVLRGLHCSESTEIIAKELSEQGHETRQIVNVLHKKTKDPLPLFFVDLEPKANNIDIFKIKTLNYTKVTFEAPYKKKEIIQCKRCQRFGHTKNQCFRPYRCVKCGGDHPTTVCTKSREIEATCANCHEKHPASYKGCVQYKQYRDKILNIKPRPKRNFQEEVKEQPPPTNHHRTFSNSGSYAEAVKKDQRRSRRPDAEPININSFNSDNLGAMLDTMFNKFQQVMTNMMDSMMDRMIQLVKTLVAK